MPSAKKYHPESSCLFLQSVTGAGRVLSRTLLLLALIGPVCLPATSDTHQPDPKREASNQDDPAAQAATGSRRPFGTDRLLSLASPITGNTLLRLTNDLSWEPAEAADSDFRIGASVRLVRIAREVGALVFPEDEVDDALGESVDDTEEPGRTRAAALFLLNYTDVGLRSSYPFIRFRVPWTHTGPDGVGQRLAAETFWRWDDGFGVGGLWLLTYPHDRRNRLALNHQIEITEASASAGSGAGWSQQLTYRHFLSGHMTLTGRLDHAGRTEPDWQTDRVRADMRLRRSIWRPWLNAELEPYLLWPRDNGFEQAPGVILRLEAVWQLPRS